MASQSDGDGGYVLLYRRLLGHTAFRNDGEALAFAWLVMKAAWRPTTVRYKDRQIRLNRGQVAVSVRDLGTQLDRPKGWVERFLKRVTDDHMVRTHAETGVSVISIMNYDIYQPSQGGAETPQKTGTGQERDRGRTQNKEGNEDNKGDIDSPSPETRVPTRDLVDLTSRLCRLAGVAYTDPGAISRAVDTVKGWLDLGVSVEDVIGPTISRTVLTSNATIRNLAYFDCPVREAAALNLAGESGLEPRRRVLPFEKPSGWR